MNINELKQFNQMFQGVCEYYGRTASSLLAEIYWRGLQSYEYVDVRRAFDAHMHNPDNGQFMPKIADVERQLHGNSSTRAMQAWQRVANAIQAVGTYETVAFDDPLIHACIEDMGGWHQIGLITNDELPFKIREFEKRYTAYLQIPPVRSVAPALIGIFDKSNQPLGYTKRDPVLIAEVERIEEQARKAALSAPKRDEALAAPDPQKKAKLDALVRDFSSEWGMPP